MTIQDTLKAQLKFNGTFTLFVGNGIDTKDVKCREGQLVNEDAIQEHGTGTLFHETFNEWLAFNRKMTEAGSEFTAERIDQHTKRITW